MSELPNGVHVVALDPDVAGRENVVWTFTEEADADVVRLLLSKHVGPAWDTYEPISESLDDPSLLEYLAARCFDYHGRDDKEAALQQVRDELAAIRKENGWE